VDSLGLGPRSLGLKDRGSTLNYKSNMVAPSGYAPLLIGYRPTFLLLEDRATLLEINLHSKLISNVLEGFLLIFHLAIRLVVIDVILLGSLD
jgi:hypothetical protein